MYILIRTDVRGLLGFVTVSRVLPGNFVISLTGNNPYWKEITMNRIAIAANRSILVLFSLIVAACGHHELPDMHAQDGSQSLQTVHATYGVEGAQMDVTQKVQAAIVGGQTNIRASNSFFGKGPAFGKTKTLAVTFVQGGVQYQTTAREGQQLSFANANVDQSNVAPQNPPAPGPAEHRLAPKGTLYLIERASVKTDTGVTGFAPGTGLKVVEDHSGSLLVTDGTIRFEVPAEIVTNDVDIARGASASDQAAQMAIANGIERSNKAAQQAKDAYNAMLDQQQREVDASRAAADAAGPHNSGKLDREAYNKSDAIVYPYGYRYPHRIYTTHSVRSWK